MSEVRKPITGEERIAKIQDIRTRKGHLLGKLATSEDRLKHSVLVAEPSDKHGDMPTYYSEYFKSDFGYVYKGVPSTAVRQADPDQSEYTTARRPLSELEQGCGNDSRCSFAGRSALSQAVERQQGMLAEELAQEQQITEAARDNRFSRYTELLGSPAEHPDETIATELSELTKEFYLPRNYQEACATMDAGGITYGIS